MQTYQVNGYRNHANGRAKALSTTLGLLFVFVMAAMICLYPALSSASYLRQTPLTATTLQIMSTTGEVDLSGIAAMPTANSLPTP